MERFAGIFALIGAVGCFEPGLRDGQITCEVEEVCPSGFVCLEGICRNQAPGEGKDDDPINTDDSPDDLPNDPPDAGPVDVAGPKVYELTAGTWDATPASEYFIGSGLNISTIATAWSQCDGAAEVRCFGDATGFACKRDTTWGKSPWNEIDSSLTGFNSTFNSSFKVDTNIWVFEAHRGEDWRGYEGPAMNVSSGGVSTQLNLEVESGQNGVPDLDQIYGDDSNAPNAFDDVVADYLDVTKNGDPWSFLSASGERFTIYDNTTDTTGGQEPTLALPGAPLAQDIRAALSCDGALLFFAVD